MRINQRIRVPVVRLVMEDGEQRGRAVLDRIVEATHDIASVELRPNMEGRRMSMILGPKAGVVRRIRQARESTQPPRMPRSRGVA